jgi:WD40 repeat protein
MWDARTRQELKKWAGHEDCVMSVAFQPDGQGIASGSSDQTWKSWNLSSLQSKSPGHIVDAAVGKEVFTCSGHKVCFSLFPPVVPFEPTSFTHKSDVVSISISPDGRWVVTSSFDHTSRIWDATAGVWVCTLKGHTAGVQGADFSPAGCYLVTGSYDRQVILWRYREVDQ